MEMAAISWNKIQAHGKAALSSANSSPMATAVARRVGRGKGVLGEPGPKGHFSSSERIQALKTRTTRVFPKTPFPNPSSSAARRGSLVWSLTNGSYSRHPSCFWADPSLRAGSLRDPREGRTQRHPKSKGQQLQPQRSRAEPQKARLLFYTQATPHGQAFCRGGGGTPFMSLDGQKVCVCLFRTKPILNWHKWNRFYK